MSPLFGWSRFNYVYTDDLGRDHSLICNDYIGEAADLERVAEGRVLLHQWPGLHPRHIKIKSTEPHPRTGKTAYKEIPVQIDSVLWNAPVGQLLMIHGVEYEVRGRVPEKERGRKKMLAQMKADAAAR
jgi:hypothetical protein